MRARETCPHQLAAKSQLVVGISQVGEGLKAKFPVTDVFSHIEVTDGRIWLKPSGVPCFAGDLPEAEQKLVYATQGVPVADLFTQKVEGTAWKTKPSWYIVAANGALRCEREAGAGAAEHELFRHLFLGPNRPSRSGTLRGETHGGHHRRDRE